MDATSRLLQTRTFHHSRFTDIDALMRRKQARGLTISLCIPTLNESRTIGPLVRVLAAELRSRVPLLDEIAVIDSGSSDRTLELAAAAGADVYRAADILPREGAHRGKGENLWKALYQLKGDILVFLDGDIANMDRRFVTGLLGPLLEAEDIGYVKAFYDRPQVQRGGSGDQEGGRVTELLVRPLLSLFFPELAAIIQPLAGEYAARRQILQALPFPVGYGVETTHLIDIHARTGLDVLAQTDLEARRHRSRSNRELGRMAFAILRVVCRRLRQRGVLTEPALEERALRQFCRQDGQCQWQEHRIDEQERPPMETLAAYRFKWGMVGDAQTPTAALRKSEESA